jgi:hypothetical protein
MNPYFGQIVLYKQSIKKFVVLLSYTRRQNKVHRRQAVNTELSVIAKHMIVTFFALTKVKLKK